MPGRPTLIGLGGPASELDYELSQGEAFRPETVTVFADGSGAASDFVVQLTLYAQSGEILSRTRTDDTVAAGGSGEATFAPF